MSSIILKLKKLLFRQDKHLVCTSLRSVLNRQPHDCLFLIREDGGMYSCWFHGFRARPSGYDGTSKRKHFRNYYDHDMLEYMKSTKLKYCFYRVASPLILSLFVIWYVVKEGWLWDLLMKIYELAIK